MIMGASARRSGGQTGLSASIFCLRQKYFRSYPLREPKPQSGFG
jgi:hypothetical protein